MPTKWLQERGDGSKNGDGIPPHRGLRGESRYHTAGKARFRNGLVVKAHRLLYHSTLGLGVIKTKKEKVPSSSHADNREGDSIDGNGNVFSIHVV